MTLDKEQNWAIFFIRVQNGHKTEETTRNISNAFGPWTANGRTVYWKFRKFCKGDKRLEDDCSGHHRKFSTINWEPSWKRILLSCWRTQRRPTSTQLKRPMSFEIGKGEKTGCLMSWQEIKKMVLFKCYLFLFYTTTKIFLIVLWHSRKSGFYTPTGEDQLGGWIKRKLQSTS